MSSKLVKEIFLLRALSCLAIVIIHSISSAFALYGIRKVPEYMGINNVLFVIQILLMFGTPMFVFISEFILANAYRDKAPKGFYINRIKYILIPYLVIGMLSSIIYTLQYKTISIQTLLSSVYEQFILGYFHGYFVLIIFQFYVLHFVFNKYIANKYDPKAVITLSILVNVCYLAYFQFFDPRPSFPSHLPFFGWIGYFAVAYYCGRNLSTFKRGLIKFKKLVICAPAVTGLIVLILCYSGLLTYIQSKRIDIIFYTITLAFLLFYIGMKFGTIPRAIVKISKYSYGIYLLHPFFLLILEKIFNSNFSIINLVIYIIVAAIVGLLGPILFAKILHRFKFGPYIIGRPGIETNFNKQDKLSVLEPIKYRHI